MASTAIGGSGHGSDRSDVANAAIGLGFEAKEHLSTTSFSPCGFDAAMEMEMEMGPEKDSPRSTNGPVGNCV